MGEIYCTVLGSDELGPHVSVRAMQVCHNWRIRWKRDAYRCAQLADFLRLKRDKYARMCRTIEYRRNQNIINYSNA